MCISHVFFPSCIPPVLLLSCPASLRMHLSLSPTLHLSGCIPPLVLPCTSQDASLPHYCPASLRMHPSLSPTPHLSGCIPPSVLPCISQDASLLSSISQDASLLSCILTDTSLLPEFLITRPSCPVSCILSCPASLKMHSFL